MPNVKPGDLCLVVGADHTPELVGTVVTVERAAYTNDRTISVCGYSVKLNPVKTRAFWISGQRTLPWRTPDGNLRFYNEVPIADMYLVKIKDGDLTLDEETEISNNTSKTKEKETQC